MKKCTFSHRLGRLADRLKPGRVLDVGCATGFFLEAAADQGWDVHGVELSEYGASVAQATFGNRVFNGTLEQAKFPENHFDLVTLSDILEHIPCPKSFLLEVKRILRPGGLVMVVTPDVRSLTARMMGRRWTHFKMEHLHYFSPETIARLMHESGFSVECQEPAPKFLNLSYIINQFRVYPHFLMTPICTGADFLFPEWIKARTLRFRCGEMLVLASATTL